MTIFKLVGIATCIVSFNANGPVKQSTEVVFHEGQLKEVQEFLDELGEGPVSFINHRGQMCDIDEFLIMEVSE